MLALSMLVHALNNGEARTPPMGFNDWNELARHYRPWSGGLNESLILLIAEALVSSGLAAKGYNYVNLDCGYSAGAINSGKPLEVNATKFPSGMRWLGVRLHRVGLRFGIYSSGKHCCDRNVRLGMEAADARLFASWGVDYVKYDDCGSTTESFESMRAALNATGRPMVYSIHSPCTHHPIICTDGPDPRRSVDLSNSWRTTNDISNSFAAVLDRAKTTDGYAKLAGPGAWNDPDMLEVGNGLSDAEGRSHFSLWCLLKAPLLIGTDLTAASETTLATLGNLHAIAVNQDALGEQGRLRAEQSGEWQLWVGPLSDGCVAALFVNLRPAGSPIGRWFSWSELGIPHNQSTDVFDLWADGKLVAHAAVGTLQFVAAGGNDCAFYRLCPSLPHL